MADKTLFVKIKSIFSPAQSRANITSGEDLETSLGKISKWFSDIGSAAFKDVPSSGNAGNSEVVLGNDSRLSDDRTPTAHNQPSSTITAMTGYTKPQSTSAIAATDTLNEAIGKLEKGLDGAGGGLQPGNVDVSTNSVTLTSSSPTATVTLSNATGAVSILCSAENFEATLSGNTITINRTGKYDEEGFVLVTVASDSTHSSNIIAISVHNRGIILCTWSGGSNEAVASMIQAAHNGDINLKNYWSVGDERTVNGITYTLKEGISYRDTSDTTKTSAFKVIFNLGSNNSIAFDNHEESLYVSGRYKTYYVRYTPAPDNSYLNNRRLWFLVKNSSISSSAHYTSIDETVNTWYGNASDIAQYSTRDEPYINGFDGSQDPANVGAWVSTDKYEPAYVNTINRYGTTSTARGTSADPSVVSNIGIIGYFLI